MLNVGDKLDNYEILDLLGSGGFGRVWRAKDLTVKGREVAIKELADPTEERLEGRTGVKPGFSTLRLHWLGGLGQP